MTLARARGWLPLILFAPLAASLGCHDPLSQEAFPQTGWRAIAAGTRNTCALTAAGHAYCWGALQVNDTLFADTARPMKVPGGHRFTAVTARGVMCGLEADTHRVYCWGAGELGGGGSVSSASPVAVADPLGPRGTGWTRISAGQVHTCGIFNSRAYCWGWNSDGQLGTGSIDQDPGQQHPSPEEVAGGYTVLEVSAGDWHTCVLTTSYDAWCWGLDDWGQLGDGASGLARREPAPVRVEGGRKFLSISAAGSHTCALDTDGKAFCWGNGWFGELGIGDVSAVALARAGSPTPAGPCSVSGCYLGLSYPTPQPVAGGHTFTALSGDHGTTCAVGRDGQSYCWGNGSSLGNPPQLCHDMKCVPAPVAFLPGIQVKTIGVGMWHACASTASGSAYCWGTNSDGQLGDGTRATAPFSNQPMPVRVLDPT